MGLIDEIEEVLAGPVRSVRVYQAGPLEPDDWRAYLDEFDEKAWPEITVVGPAFCADAVDQAGVLGLAPEAEWTGDSALLRRGGAVREILMDQRHRELESADAVFAWFAQRDAYWAAAEVALAHAYGIPVFVALLGQDYPCHPGADPTWTLGEGWERLAYILGLAHQVAVTPSAAAAWQLFVDWCRDPKGPVARRVATKVGKRG